MGPNLLTFGSSSAPFLDHHLNQFLFNFGMISGVIRETIWGQARAKMRQNCFTRGIKSCKITKTCMHKHLRIRTLIRHRFLLFWGSKASAWGSRWLLRRLEITPEQLQELMKRGKSNIESYFNNSFDWFFEPFCGPELAQESTQDPRTDGTFICWTKTIDPISPEMIWGWRLKTDFQIF